MKAAIAVDEDWYELPEKVTFQLEMGGKKLTANLLAGMYVIDPYFKIDFSDGHKDIYSIQDWKIFNSNDKSDAYSKALEKEIHSPLFSWSKSKQIACVPVEINAEEVNAWIIWYNKDEPVPEFDVFIKNSKQLTIKKDENEWEIEKIKFGLPVRKAALDKIKKAIDEILKK